MTFSTGPKISEKILTSLQQYMANILQVLQEVIANNHCLCKIFLIGYRYFFQNKQKKPSVVVGLNMKLGVYYKGVG